MAKQIKKNVVGILVLVGMALLASVGGLLLASLPSPNPDAYAAQAEARRDEGEFNSARLLFLRAYTKDPRRRPEFLVEAARCALESGLTRETYADVVKYINNARIKDVNHKGAAELSVEVEYEIATQPNIGNIQQWTRLKDEARRLVEDIDSESALGYRALGTALVKLREENPQNAAKGRTMLNRALELEPCDADALERLAKNFWLTIGEREKEGDSRGADRLQKELDQIINRQLSACNDDQAQLAQMRLVHATNLIHKEEVDRGVKQLEEIAASDVGSFEANIFLGQIYAQSLTTRLRRIIADYMDRDYNKSNEFFQRAKQLDPSDGNPYLYLGLLYMQLYEDITERESKQIELYKQGLENVEYGEDIRRFVNLDHRARFMNELFRIELSRAERAANEEDDKTAEQHHQSAKEWIAKLEEELGQNRFPVMVLKAQMLYAQGKIIEATKMGEEAAAMPPSNRFYEQQLDLVLGELYRVQQQWGAAAKSLQKAYNRQPDNPIIHLRLGNVYLNMGQPALAIRLLKPDEAGPLRDYLLNNPMAIQYRINAYQQLGKRELIDEELARTSDHSPDDFIRQAQLHITEEQYGEAEDRIKAALKEDPGHKLGVQLLVHLYLLTERQKQAQKFVDDRLKRDPDNRLFQRLQLTLSDNDDPEARDRLIVEFIEREPDELSRYAQLYNFYSSRDQMEEAGRYLDKAEQLQPDNRQIILKQFRKTLFLKDWQRAEKYVKIIGDRNYDGAEGRMVQGRLAYARKEFPKAAKLMESALRDFPTNSLGWTYLADVYNALGRNSNAKDCLFKALEINPANGFANRGMAQMLLQDSDPTGARKYLEAAIRVMPNDYWVREQLDIQRETDNPSQGITTREKKRIQEPDNLENLVLLARLYAHPDIRRYDKAEEVYRQALDVSGSNLDLAREIAGFFGREEVNRPTEGEQLLEELLEAQKNDADRAVVAAYFGQFFESMKNLSRAEAYFRMAIDLDPSPSILKFFAEYYARNNNYHDALEYYDRIRAQACTETTTELCRESRERIIAILLTIHELDRAIEEIATFRGDYPDDTQGNVYYAAYHRIGGDVDEALEAFDKQIVQNPQNSIALWQRGSLYMLKGQHQLAVKDLQRAKAISPDGFAYQHRISLAEALLKIGREAQAVNELREILEDRPEHKKVSESLVDIYLRVRPAVRYRDAIQLVSTFAARFPEETTWPLLLGKIGQESNDHSLTIDGFTEAAVIGRKHPEIVRQLFNAYRRAGRAKDLIRYAEVELTVAQIERSPITMCDLAWAYKEDDKLDKCLEIADRALLNAGGLGSKTVVLQQLIRILGERAVLDRISTQSLEYPNDINRQKALFILLQALERTNEAIEAGDKVDQLAKNDNDKVFAKLGKAMLLDKLGRYDEAKPLYEATLQINPDEAYALNNLSYLLAERQGKIKEALPYAKRAHQLDTTNPIVLDTYGWLLARDGQFVEAEGYLLRAIEANGRMVAAIYHLGMVYEYQNNRRYAVKWLKEARKVVEDPKTRDATRNNYLPKIKEALKKMGEAT